MSRKPFRSVEEEVEIVRAAMVAMFLLLITTAGVLVVTSLGSAVEQAQALFEQHHRELDRIQF